MNNNAIASELKAIRELLSEVLQKLGGESNPAQPVRKNIDWVTVLANLEVGQTKQLYANEYPSLKGGVKSIQGGICNAMNQLYGKGNWKSIKSLDETYVQIRVIRGKE